MWARLACLITWHFWEVVTGHLREDGWLITDRCTRCGVFRVRRLPLRG